MPSFPRPAALRSPGWTLVAAVVALAAALRAVAVWRWAGDVAVDVDMYRGLAANLLAGEGYVSPETGVATAFRPPLVPLIYAALGNADWAILLFQVVAGAATAGLTMRLVRTLGLGWKAAALAGTIVACDPILLRYTPRPMTEVTAALLTVALLCRVCRGEQGSRDREGASLAGAASPGTLPHGRSSLGGALLTGALFGLSALCRPTVWAFGGLWALGWLWDRLRGRAGWLHGWGRLALGALGVALIVGPWAVRNWVVFDRPIVMTTHGGYTLHLANNEVFYREVVRGPAGAVWDGESLLRWQRRTEADRSAEFFIAGTAGPIDDPGAGPDAAEVRAMLEAPRRDMSPGTSISPTVHAWTGGPDLTRLVMSGGVNEVLRDRETFIDREAERGRFWRYSHSRIADDGSYRSFLVRIPPPADGPAADRWHRDRALEVIRSDPGGFARAVPLRISRLWSPVPQGPAAEGLPGPIWWAVGGWNVVAFLLAAAGAVRVWRSDRWAAWRPVLLMVLSLTAVHAVYWSNARMRGPIVPAIAALVAAGACGTRRRGEAAMTEPEPPPEVESFGGEGKS